MKNKKQYLTLVLSLLCLLMVGCNSRYVESYQTYPVCEHMWLKWSNPTTGSTWYDNRALYQVRVCDTCGKAEKRWVY